MATPSVLLLFLVGTAAWALHYLLRASAPGRTDGPACGQCGYSVEGAMTFVCPECGADLRDVGITVPKPYSFAARALLWTLAFLFFASVLSPVIDDFRPRVLSSSTLYTVVGPSPMGNYEVSARLDGKAVRCFPGNAPTRATTATITRRDLRRSLHVDLDTGHCDCTDASCLLAGPFDAPTFRRWLLATEPNPSDPDCVAYADAVFGLIAKAASQASAGRPIDSATATCGPPPPPPAKPYNLAGFAPPASVSATDHPLGRTTVTAFWTFLWVVGLATLYSRAGRRSRAAHVTSTPGAE